MRSWKRVFGSRLSRGWTSGGLFLPAEFAKWGTGDDLGGVINEVSYVPLAIIKACFTISDKMRVRCNNGK